MAKVNEHTSHKCYCLKLLKIKYNKWLKHFFTVYLSDNQVKKILKAIKDKSEIRINFQNKPPNYTLKLKKTQTGGFIPIALAPLIAKAALAGLVSYGTQKVAKKISGSGKSSTCKCKNKCSKKGRGLYQNWENR